MPDSRPPRDATRWIKLYGWVVVVASLYGITIAHLPVILGHPWTVCQIDGAGSLPCVLTIHLYDAVLTILLLLFGWYSLKRATPDRVEVYLSLLVFALVIEMAFFTFEIVELLWNFHNQAAAWENWIIASIALILLGGFMLGVYVHLKVSSLSR